MIANLGLGGSLVEIRDFMGKGLIDLYILNLKEGGRWPFSGS